MEVCIPTPRSWMTQRAIFFTFGLEIFASKTGVCKHFCSQGWRGAARLVDTHLAVESSQERNHIGVRISRKLSKAAPVLVDPLAGIAHCFGIGAACSGGIRNFEQTA